MIGEISFVLLWTFELAVFREGKLKCRVLSCFVRACLGYAP